MQTFLPYDDFISSAKVLDYRRLGKQRVETLQILNQLTQRSIPKGMKELPEDTNWVDFVVPMTGRGWGNHPMTRMWRGYEDALTIYGCVMSSEWMSRGYRDTCYEKLLAVNPGAFERKLVLPPWMGWVEFHMSHQSNLVRKDSGFYRPFFGDISPDLEYVWPTPLE